MKTVLILGAAACQLPIIRRCRAMGLRVLAASMPGPYPGFREADRAVPIDLRNRDALLQVARDERIDAVLTDQTDIPVATAAWIAGQLGLPGIGYDVALRFTNKRLMREACAALGVPVPRSRGVRTSAELEAWADQIGLPLMLKPADSQGSRGVQCIRRRDQLAAGLAEAIRHSATQEAVAEEFFVGREVVVQGFAGGGRFTNLVMGDRRYFGLPDRFIPQATLFPTNLPAALRDRIFDINRTLVTGFGLPFGITHSEYLVQPATGEIRLVEVAARGGGVFISSDLVPLSCGIDVNELLIRNALGERLGVDAAAPRPAAAGYVCFTLPEGTVTEAPNAAEVAARPGVHRVHLDDLPVGRAIGGMNDKTMRLGPILIKASDRSGLDAVHQDVRRTLRVTVQTADGQRGPVWD